MAPEEKAQGRVALGLFQQVVGLAGWLALSAAVAWFGSQFSPGPWYASLDKAPWTPPGSAFGVAWSILYTLMAIAAWLVWRRGGFSANLLPLSAYGVQMVFNGLWSWLFFGLGEAGWALLDLLLLLFAVAATLLLFGRRSKAAMFLLIPYVMWLLLALSLNAWIWRYN